MLVDRVKYGPSKPQTIDLVKASPITNPRPAMSGSESFSSRVHELNLSQPYPCGSDEHIDINKISIFFEVFEENVPFCIDVTDETWPRL